MFNKFLLTFIVPIIVFIGCGSKLQTSVDSPLELVSISGPDITPPTVQSVSPPNGANPVSVHTGVTAIFSEKMDQTSINISTFTVWCPVPGNISGTITRTATSATFTPASQLPDLNNCIATLTTGVTDAAGNNLAANETWSFTVENNTVNVPVFTNPGGAYLDGTTAPVTVNLNCSYPAGATIRYTTDGSDPSQTSGTIYSAPISVSQNTTIKAIAYMSGFTDSAIATESYIIQTAPPVIATSFPGTYNTDVNVDFICATSGASIHYTDDGSTPTAASNLYTAGTPIQIAGDGTSVTVQAIAVKTGLDDSTVTSGAYSITYDTAAPQFTPSTGTYFTDQIVLMHSNTSGATIRFTTDGSDPVSFGTDVPNDTSIFINQDTTLQAYAYASGRPDSGITAATYFMAPMISSIQPNNGQASGGPVTTLITGTNFKNLGTLTVRMTKAGEPDIPATSVAFIDSNNLNCTFDISSSALDQWNVVVDNGDGGNAVLPVGFRIYELPTGLANWWKFDNDLIDYEGGNNGTAAGSINYGMSDRLGNPNSAVSITGSAADYISAAVSGSQYPYGNTPRTMMGWINLNTLAAGDNFLFGYGQSPSNLFTLSVTKVALGAGVVSFNNSITEAVNGATLLHVGHWNHVAVTYDGATTVKLYVNGVLDETGSISAALITPWGTNMNFHFTPGISSGCDGAIDDVRIYDVELTAADIQNITADNQYLLPPQNVQATKGTLPASIDLSWDPVTDATGYHIYRDTTLSFSTAVLVNVTPVSGTSFTDSDPTLTTSSVYFYKIRAVNATHFSDYSEMVSGYLSGAMTTYYESFEGGFNVAWDSISGNGSVPYSFDTGIFLTDVTSLLVGPSACAGGCGFSYSLSLTKTFGTPISYFDVSVAYRKQNLTSGKVGIYVNDMAPTDNTNLVPFLFTMSPGGSWIKRSALYMDASNIYSITILLYDITSSNAINADDITIHTMP